MDASSALRSESAVQGVESRQAAVSWGAILGGAVAAAALSLILLALGSGLGLSSISPWAYEGASATTLAASAIVWLLVMAALASGLGGYLAGRLRVKWSDVNADEAFFRDTAHGLLAWAVATVVSAAILTSAATSMVGGAVRTGAAATAAVAGTAVGATAAEPGANTTTAAAPSASDAFRNYFVDMLYRTDRPLDPGANMDAVRRETAGIFANALAQGELSQGDRAYLTQLVAARTGLSPADAEQRVTKTAAAAKLTADAASAKAREAAEAARKASAYAALWIFVSLLLGAFCAALAATVGGRQRDSRTQLRRPL
jgi:hypothetical protein